MSSFTTSMTISANSLANLAITAFELNYLTASWCGEVKPVSLPQGLTAPWYADPKFWESDFQIAVKLDGPNDPEGSRRSGAVIGRAEVQTGLDKMANDYPSHLGDFINENYDAETADAWWQCCVLGDIIYG